MHHTPHAGVYSWNKNSQDTSSMCGTFSNCCKTTSTIHLLKQYTVFKLICVLKKGLQCHDTPHSLPVYTEQWFSHGMELELIHFLPGASEHLQVHKVSQMTYASYRRRRVGRPIAVALLRYAYVPLTFCWQGGHASRVGQTHAAGRSFPMSGVWGTGWKGFKYRVWYLQFAEVVEALLCYLGETRTRRGLNWCAPPGMYVCEFLTNQLTVTKHFCNYLVRKTINLMISTDITQVFYRAPVICYCGTKEVK